MPVQRSDLDPFRCDVEPDRAAVRVCPVGELGFATVAVVDAQLAELWSVGFARLVLDLRGVTHLDSTGLRMLTTWQERSAADGFAFGVIPGPPAVQRAFETMGVADRLTSVSAGG
jgi:anti-sigma B factor antagonist